MLLNELLPVLILVFNRMIYRKQIEQIVNVYRILISDFDLMVFSNVNFNEHLYKIISHNCYKYLQLLILDNNLTK